MCIRDSGMVVTSDVGDAKHIHPADKPNVGKRLALWALAKTYNIPDVYKRQYIYYAY